MLHRNMSLRRRAIALPFACLAIVILTLYFGREHLARAPWPSSFGHGLNGSYPAGGANVHHVLSVGNVTRYVDSIMNPDAIHLPRLECPVLSGDRYRYLKSSTQETTQYFFALDLRQALELLPQLIGSVVAAIRFLGPERCTLSIIGGNSPDGTTEVLEALQSSLGALSTYYFRSSDIDPSVGGRIEKLAILRNMALQPLLGNATRYAADTTVVFLNDVTICLEDILELVHQQRFLGADMTCAFDWTYAGQDPTFYDVWVARGMNGDSFFEIPPDGNWNSAWNLFWNNPPAQSSFNAHRPFQVFSCWNGAVVFTAKPLVEGQIRFRAPNKHECFQGEPQLFCKDMWFHGYGKIATIPTVNLAYSLESGKKIKQAKGYTSQWTREGAAEEERIQWQIEPPERVKCIPSYDAQVFKPWNSTLF
ncbi:alpha-1,3-mannosyltransferase CMT1 [Thozetella sp. PMI_491]|nr:alpha-1,3-mannosyltransferase CMT1 [Thozetella sp. PMI_491]